MKRMHLGVLLLLSFIFFSCQKELKVSGIDTPTSPGGSVTLKTTIQGNITDENGQPMSGVSIKAGNQTVVTDNHGYFRAKNAIVDANAALVVAEKQGYFKGYRTFRATSGTNQVMIQMIKKTAAGDVDAAAGGSATLTNGAKIALPANGIVLANGGTPYTGTVKVYAAYIDPTAQNISKVLPGSFMADDKDNKRVVLASYGMLAVELETPAGVKLQVRSGSEATLTTPIPALLQASAPSTISLWYVDEQSGLWKEQGSATKSGNSYVGTVKHFSFWNCDVSSTSINLSMTLRNPEGSPLVHVLVKLSRTGGAYPSSSYGITDSLGQVSGAVPSGESLLMEVLDPCYNAVYSQTVGPFSTATNLGVISINTPGAHIVTIKGKLLNCSNAPVTNGYAVISFDNVVRYAAVDAGGNFSIATTSCTTTSGSCDVIGVDNSNLQQSNAVTVPVTIPVTNAGTIAACGNSAAVYINYTLDGTSYAINGIVDSAMMYRDSVQTTGGNNHLLAMGNHGNDFILFGFTATATGTYPLDQLRVQGLTGTVLIPAVNVTLTAYPQVTGGFFEGSFTGQFQDALNVTHNINCSFRLRRNW
jgi:hypothetical protein